MATLLKKDVHRELYNSYKIGLLRESRIIVTLEAGDMLTFREKGRRTTYSVPLGACMNLAFIQKLNEIYQDKMKVYKERKSLGLRAIRPKMPPKIFSNKFYESLMKKTIVK